MKQTLTIPPKEIPVLLDRDVLVVGAGVSGWAAAVAAKDGVPVNAVDVARVQDELRNQDVLLDV